MDFKRCFSFTYISTFLKIKVELQEVHRIMNNFTTEHRFGRGKVAGRQDHGAGATYTCDGTWGWKKTPRVSALLLQLTITRQPLLHMCLFDHCTYLVRRKEVSPYGFTSCLAGRGLWGESSESDQALFSPGRVTRFNEA